MAGEGAHLLRVRGGVVLGVIALGKAAAVNGGEYVVPGLLDDVAHGKKVY